jgi:hypothetical protein
VAVGIPLGILVGLASGAAFIVFLRAAFRNDAMKAAGSLLAMPTSWFGGGWLTEVFDLDQILSWYLTSLAVCFLAIGGYPLFRAVVRIGNELGTAE